MHFKLWKRITLENPNKKRWVYLTTKNELPTLIPRERKAKFLGCGRDSSNGYELDSNDF